MSVVGVKNYAWKLVWWIRKACKRPQETSQELNTIKWIVSTVAEENCHWPHARQWTVGGTVQSINIYFWIII